MTAEHLSHDAPPPASVDAARRLARTELSLGARLAHVALLLVALAMSGAMTSLWLTESDLPPRTQIAFAAIVAIGLSWAVFAIHVLTTTRVLLARHRVVAGRMAVVFTAVFIGGSVAVGVATGQSGAYGAASFGGVMLAVAVWGLVRANHAMARLADRRAALERELAGRGQP